MRRGSRGYPRISCALGALWLVTVSAPAGADTVQLVPTKDNTIYEDGGGALSNGIGPRLFAGVTKGDDIVRSLLAFDVAGSIPAGSIVQSATLTLNVSLEPSGNTSAHTFLLHRVSADWGEGTSDAGNAGGAGDSATAGDATWLHSFFDTGFWASAGGDFAATPSASQGVGPGLGNVAFTSAGLAGDVQSWLDAPGANFGWVIRTDETGTGTARRFDSKDNATPAVRPVLEVEFTTPSVPALPAWGGPVLGVSMLLAVGLLAFATERASPALRRRGGSR